MIDRRDFLRWVSATLTGVMFMPVSTLLNGAQKPQPFPLSQNIVDALNGANAPDGANVFATINDLPSVALPYKLYAAMLTQSGTSDPSIVKENYNDTGCTMAITRVNVGTYSLVATGPLVFTQFETVILIQNRPPRLFEITAEVYSGNEIRIYTASSGVMSDSVLNFTPLEIHAFPT